MIFVTGRGKSSLVDYFDIGFELEATLEKARQEPRPARRARAPASARSSRSASSSRSGLAMPSGARAHIVGDEPFAVLLPDDLMVGTARRAQADGRRLCRRSAATSSAPRKSPADKTASYGIITPGATRRQRAPKCAAWSRSPQPGRRAVAARRGRPLHPPARGDGDPRARRARRGRRDPADRRAWPG